MSLKRARARHECDGAYLSDRWTRISQLLTLNLNYRSLSTLWEGETMRAVLPLLFLILCLAAVMVPDMASAAPQPRGYCACTYHHNPVCGSDGRSYASSCFARCRGVSGVIKTNIRGHAHKMQQFLLPKPDFLMCRFNVQIIYILPTFQVSIRYYGRCWGKTEVRFWRLAR